MSILFISDLHLDSKRPELTGAFLSFIKSKKNQYDALYILGDLFEVWIGDDADISNNKAVIDALYNFSKNTPCYFQHGNRDFLIGEAFATATGCQLLPEKVVINPYGEPVLLMHGDTLCTADTDYLAFRKMVRSSQWQTDFLNKPIAERQAIAEALRQQSQNANSNKAEDIMDVTQSDVIKDMQHFGVNTLIHGHTHRPAIHCIDENKKRIVLGDWGNTGWMATLDNDGVDLKEFSLV